MRSSDNEKNFLGFEMKRFVRLVGCWATASALLLAVPALAADFNGDGKTDVLWRQAGTGVLAVWALSGNSPPSGYGVGSPLSNDWVVQGLRDFNGDGRADVLLRQTSTGVVAVWVLNGASVQYSYGVGSAMPADWTIEALGDFDGDGKADILWRQNSTGMVALWLLGGGTQPAFGGGWVLPHDWAIQGVGDFNGDGKSDILWRQSSTGTAAVWILSGGTLQYGYGVGDAIPVSDWGIVGIGDFDGDGRADILWRQRSTGSLAVWALNGASVRAAYGIGSAVSADWLVQDVGDVDGDRKADIVWRNSSTGTVATWLLNGGTTAAFGGNWQVALDWAIRPTSRGTIKLAWDDNSSTEAGFIVERSANGSGAWVEAGRTAANVSTFTDIGLSPFQRYQYRVKAYQGSQSSSYSNLTNGMPP